MYIKSILAMIIALNCAACGGSGGSGTSLGKAAVLTERPDGSGLLRAVVQTPNGEATSLILTADVNREYQDALAHDGTQIADIRNLDYSFSDTYSDYYTAQVVVDGELADVLIAYAKSDYQTFAYYGETSTENAAATGGMKATNMPSGIHSYVGSNVVANRDGSSPEFGTFTMGVNFDTKTASINGSTASTSIDATGMTVDTSSGTFNTNDLRYRVNGIVSQAKLEGLFHGNGATGVTGVYFADVATPATSGILVGVKTP